MSSSSAASYFSRTYEDDNNGGGKRRHLNPRESAHGVEPPRNHQQQYSSNNNHHNNNSSSSSHNNINNRNHNNQGGSNNQMGSSGFLFDRNNRNPTQSQVDDFFRNKPELNAHEIVNIFLRAVQWKKKKRIDVLIGDKLSFVTDSLLRIVSKLDGRQTTQITMATVNGLQSIAPASINTSGQW